jgi:hypothetical protein
LGYSKWQYLRGRCGWITRQLGNIKNDKVFFKTNYILYSNSSLTHIKFVNGCRLCDFWYEAQKKAKKYTRDNGLQGWNNVVVCKDFRLSYISKDIWVQYIHHVMFEWFTWRSQSGAENQNWQIHGSVTTHIDGSVLFIAHTKRMVRLILMTSIFNYFFVIYKYI